ncbi:MAG: hypothetical protein NTY68_04855, partial [Candidatus Micrarchaeota archaeon]|nr:hypothetical protein [Candidatus Micrarchaeota archaeon]
HPVLRIRKNGNHFEMTKKYPVKEGDASHMHEETIVLNEQEFNSLKSTDGKIVHKIRHYYSHEGRTAEIDVFQGALSGLVIIDFEFETMEQKSSFSMPDFCLAEVTQEEGLAGGMLCGKSFGEIKDILDKYRYSKLRL